MKHLTKKLLVAVALAGSAVSIAALPAAASVAVQGGALFDGFGKSLDEDVALANAETAARQNALRHGFSECDVFESTTSQDARTHVFFAVVTVRCEDVAAL
ncbi:hypothetical protein ACIBG8_43140 [Nonomuraea sp. NPDC050556]|uniref:hypothetical protein n=1 Tax=Nonomuraea sp. NPDC050556 TaxID=3364369 RepID=UPI0037884C17